MSVSTVNSIEKGVHELNIWLKDIKGELKFSDNDAYVALRATLHILRDRMTIEEATHLGAQLPIIVKGVFYDKWKLSGKPEKMDKLTFISRIHAQFNNDPGINPNDVVRVVFYVLKKNITKGEIEDIKAILPSEIGNLFDLAAQKGGENERNLSVEGGRF
jgi:uncharacterized protein (DUF2267 family)